jgi:hypothetical protein
VSTAAYAIEPLNLADADLHVTDFNSVALLSAMSDEFDAQMASAEQSEAQATTAVGDLADTSAALDQSMSDADAAGADFDPTVFVEGGAEIQTNTPGMRALANTGLDILDSANQPLSNLQQDDTPDSLQEEANAQMNSYLQQYRSAPEGAQALMETPEEYDAAIQQQTDAAIAQLEQEQTIGG